MQPIALPLLKRGYHYFIQ